ncbi:MAG: HNH endonuclease [Candidatus Accumulibacter sp.]|uniref:HNH endonuclease n=1 Tax=Accumulibacter sp. TaxID=2053492 RepID=UPI00258DFD42|nr:HNH endonuclease [Accumulibacter sp.]MCM8620249.1 HNH endonuclease [Accumulibacter sp.]
MKQLDRLLFEQGGECFFCKQPLSKADASIEHLLAQANGGTSAEENVVACCKAINSLLGNKPLKEKLAIILRQRQGFRCPARSAAAEPNIAQLPEAPAPKPLPKPSTQKPVEQNTGPAAKNSPKLPKASPPSITAATRLTTASSPSPTSATTVLCPTCRCQVASAAGQVDYVCSHCHSAFRY